MQPSRAIQNVNHDKDWGMVVLITFLSLACAWFVAAGVAWYFASYDGILFVAQPIVTAFRWNAGMYLIYTNEYNIATGIATAILALIAIDKVVDAARTELARTRSERGRHAKHVARSQKIDDRVAQAAATLNDTDEVVYYITNMPFHR